MASRSPRAWSRSPHPSMPPRGAAREEGAEALASFGVRDLDGLVRFAPRRYSIPAPLRSLHDVREGEEMSALVEVRSIRDRRMRSRHGFILEAIVSDGADEITLTFFLAQQHLVDWHRGRLPVGGARILVRGTVRWNGRTPPQLAHPDYELRGHPP